MSICTSELLYGIFNKKLDHTRQYLDISQAGCLIATLFRIEVNYLLSITVLSVIIIMWEEIVNYCTIIIPLLNIEDEFLPVLSPSVYNGTAKSYICVSQVQSNK